MKFIERFLSDLFGSWSTNIVLLVGLIIGLKHSLVLVGFSIIFFLYSVRSFVWSYYQIIEINIKGDFFLIVYRVFNSDTELEIPIDDVSIKLSPVFVKDNLYKMTLQLKGRKITQYPSSYWDKDKMFELKEILGG